MITEDSPNGKYEGRGFLVLSCDYEQRDSRKVKAIIEIFKKNFPNIEVENTEPGSIKITLGGSQEELKEIEHLIKKLKLKKIEGIKINKFSLSKVENKDSIEDLLKDSGQKTQVAYYGTGRRKSSSACVRLMPGTGKIVINHRLGDEYLQYNPSYLSRLTSPLEILGLEKNFDIVVKVVGGGLSGQADAIRLGVARALCELEPENRQPLKREGLLTRDPRSKERKKYGLKKARKAPQYSKR